MNETSAGNARYASWVATIKKTLKEREAIFIGLRRDAAVNIANDELSETDCTPVQQSEVAGIVTQTEARLFGMIEEWNGLQLKKLKCEIRSFPDYEKRSKRWWDQTKKKVFGTLFWLKMLRHLYAHIDNAPPRSRGTHETFTKQVFLKVLAKILHADIKYQKKKQPLINRECVINSEELQKFLYRLDASLNIKQWIEQQNTINKNKQIDEYHYNSTEVMKRIKTQIASILRIKTEQSVSKDEAESHEYSQPTNSEVVSNRRTDMVSDCDRHPHQHEDDKNLFKHTHDHHDDGDHHNNHNHNNHNHNNHNHNSNAFGQSGSPSLAAPENNTNSNLMNMRMAISNVTGCDEHRNQNYRNSNAFASCIQTSDSNQTANNLNNGPVNLDNNNNTNTNTNNDSSISNNMNSGDTSLLSLLQVLRSQLLAEQNHSTVNHNNNSSHRHSHGHCHHQQHGNPFSQSLVAQPRTCIASDTRITSLPELPALPAPTVRHDPLHGELPPHFANMQLCSQGCMTVPVPICMLRFQLQPCAHHANAHHANAHGAQQPHPHPQSVHTQAQPLPVPVIQPPVIQSIQSTLPLPPQMPNPYICNQPRNAGGAQGYASYHAPSRNVFDSRYRPF